MMNVTIKYTGFIVAPLKAHAQAGYVAFKAIAMHWIREMRSKHFTEAGAREYGYTPRKGEGSSGKRFWSSYTGRKKKKFGHRRPLVFSGESRRSVRHNTRVNVSKGGKFAKITMRAPKLNFRHPASKINMRDELSTISLSEAKELAEVFNDQYRKKLIAVQMAKVVTLK